MKKFILCLIVICLFTGCGVSEKEYTATPKGNDVNNQVAGDILIENKAFTINDNSTELLLGLTNENDKEIYIKSIKIYFEDTAGNDIYEKNVSVDKKLASEESYDITVTCNKALVETADYRYELIVK